MSGHYFTLIIPVTEASAHLLPFTLDVIGRQKPTFEVIVVDGTHRGISFKGVRRLAVPSHQLFALMNAAIPLAKGRYVHFLQPGEFYMSTQSLAWVQQCARENGEPDLISCGYFVRHRFEAPTPMLGALSEEALRRAEIAPTLQPYWFKTETLHLMGKFSTRYEERAGLDLLCRFFAAPQLRKAHLRRIVTDYEYRYRLPSRILKEFAETASISFKYYGVHFHFFFWMARSYLRLVRWCSNMLKRAFMNRAFG